jgi:hypothetical protein
MNQGRKSIYFDSVPRETGREACSKPALLRRIRKCLSCMRRPCRVSIDYSYHAGSLCDIIREDPTVIQQLFFFSVVVQSDEPEMNGWIQDCQEPT